MSFKRFHTEDLIYNTLVARPEYEFIVQNGKVYRNNEILADGDFSNKIKHISDGELSFHELNVNRPDDSKIKAFIKKETTRYAYRTVSTSVFDDSSQFQYGNEITQNYPISASLSRIYIPAGIERDDHTFENIYNPSLASKNKKYIRALRNVLASREVFGQSFDYGNLGTKAVNMVCVPAIFYGSKVTEGSIELNYYLSGTLVSQLRDYYKDGVLIETIGDQVGKTAGYAIYEQGIFVLTGSWDLHDVYTDQFTTAVQAPSWLSFGTGITQAGVQLSHGNVVSSSYGVKFKGLNKIPTLTMLAFSEKGEHGYSSNPTFFEAKIEDSHASQLAYKEERRNIKNINSSGLENHSASFKSITYISKVGIYDENKNLIAIASLANPIKKTPKRDFMIKMRIDF